MDKDDDDISDADLDEDVLFIINVSWTLKQISSSSRSMISKIRWKSQSSLKRNENLYSYIQLINRFNDQNIVGFKVGIF